MAFDVSEFSANIGAYGGLQNPSKFRCRAFSPTGSAPFFEFLCESANEPGLTVASALVFPLGYGAPVDVPLVPGYGEFQITCYLDNAGNVQGFLTKWQQAVVNSYYAPGGATAGQAQGAYPFQVSYSADYWGTLELDKFDQSGNVVRTVQVYGAWPKSISGIAHSWSGKDQIATIQVTMAMRSWTASDMNSNDGGEE